MLQQDDDDNGPEKNYKLSCGHLYPCLLKIMCGVKENKTVPSQFTKNKDVMKITVHGELNIYFSFHGK